MVHRWYYKQLGGHTHVRVFAGTHEGATGKCGDLVYRNEEWAVVRVGLERCGVQLVRESGGTDE